MFIARGNWVASNNSFCLFSLWGGWVMVPTPRPSSGSGISSCGYGSYGRWPADGWIYSVYLCQRHFRSYQYDFRQHLVALRKEQIFHLSSTFIHFTVQMPQRLCQQEQRSNMPSWAGIESSHSTNEHTFIQKDWSGRSMLSSRCIGRACAWFVKELNGSRQENPYFVKELETGWCCYCGTINTL